MKKYSYYLTAAAFLVMSTGGIATECDCYSRCIVNKGLRDDITNELPAIESGYQKNFDKIPDVAQYKGADWGHVVGISKNIPLQRAFEIAGENSEITFFFYTKGRQMVLEKEDGHYRRFQHGDAVFFSGQPSWGSAPGLADGYVKKPVS